MKQIAVRFGARAAMVGVLALPDQEVKGKRALLVWNTGISHRVGPQRMNVEIAQNLTRLGLPVFRFDLSGRGDSGASEDAIQSAVLDVQEAMNFLSAEYGFEEFILHGLCSGAIEAHYVAASDRRIVGLSMVDTYSYRVGQYYWHYLRKRAFSKQAWSRLLGRRKGSAESGEQEAIDQFFVPFPSLSVLQADYRAFAERELPCHVIFTSGYEHVFNYEGQFQEMLKEIDLRSLLTLRYLKEADHLLSVVEQKERMIDSLSQWVSSRFILA